MQRVIEVLISPTGEVSIQTKGYAGADCLQASKLLEEALGVVRSEQKTAEFYQIERSPAAGAAVRLSAMPFKARSIRPEHARPRVKLLRRVELTRARPRDENGHGFRTTCQSRPQMADGSNPA